MAADPGEAPAFNRAAIDGDELANDVVIADFEARGFAAVADILRREADGRKRKEAIILADCCWAIDGYVRDQFAGFAEFDVCTYCAIRTDSARWMDFRGGIEDGNGMDTHWCGLRRTHSGAVSSVSGCAPRPRSRSTRRQVTV